MLGLPTTTLLDLPPRYMWGWGPGLSGYCGSASLQTAAIYHGNWLTEDAVRGTSGGRNASHELLIVYPEDAATKGTAIASACEALKLSCAMWDYRKHPTPQHAAFLAWAAQHVDAGHPMIVGLYWAVESDADYDHIVPLVGYESEQGEVSAVYFNDLHTNASTRAAVSSFVRTRTHCTGTERFAKGSFCLPRDVDYGVAVTGNHDSQGALLPVRLAVRAWTEPDYSKEDARHEAPRLLSATVTASALTPGARYAMLRFDDPAAVPDANFLAAPFASKTEFVATTASWTAPASFMSNSTTLFRCVRVDAPGVEERFS